MDRAIDGPAAQSWRELKGPLHELRGLHALSAVLVLGFAGAGGSCCPAAVHRLLAGCEVETLDDTRARAAGTLVGRARTSDIVDANVVEGALRRGDLIYPGRAGGPWLCSTFVRSLFHAVVVPSGLRTRVQPWR